MKLLIAGSRSIKEFDLSKHIPANTELIITGGANGVDNLAEKYADDHRISKLVIRPRYDLYGKSAVLKRNETTVDNIQPNKRNIKTALILKNHLEIGDSIWYNQMRPSARGTAG